MSETTQWDWSAFWKGFRVMTGLTLVMFAGAILTSPPTQAFIPDWVIAFVGTYLVIREV